MKTITVQITYDDPAHPEDFQSLDAQKIWEALQRAYPLSRGSAWTVQELDADNRSTITIGNPVGGLHG